MKRVTILLIATFVALYSVSAQRTHMSRSKFTKWCAEELSSDSFNELPYRFARFGKGGQAAPALVVWFHGGHSSGTDNKKHIGTYTDAVSKIAYYLQITGSGAIFAAPHCSEQMRANPDYAVSTLCGWIDHLVAKEGIDRDKIYLIGASFGGMLVSKIASARPDIPAAIEIIASTPHIQNATKDDFAICCVASDEGRPRKLERTELRIYQLKEQGFDVRFIVNLGLSHQEVCHTGIDRNTLDWLFSH